MADLKVFIATDIGSAITHGVETTSVDYKASFDLTSDREWIEIVKDVVAIANSGGGMIVIGLSDDGALSDFDCGALDGLDPAQMTDRIYKYTGDQFAGFTFHRTTHNTKVLFIITINGAANPIVFSKPGTYHDPSKKTQQSTVFGIGTTYFRHGAKSEPANSADLRAFIEVRIEQMRKAWFEGIVKVVEAPPGSRVEIAAPTDAADTSGPVRLVNDPNAPAMRQVAIDDTHPYRQKEVVAEVNKALQGVKVINSYHIQCVRQAHAIESNPTFAYKMNFASPRYSPAFVDWVVEQFKGNEQFFEDAKERVQSQRA